VRKRLTNQARLLEHFQARWRREYLTALREFHKVSGRNAQSVKVGDIVLIHDDGPRLHWRLAIVDSLIQGNDGLVRAVNVHTNNRITSRPINRLYPLEISSPPDSQMDSGDNAAETDKDQEDNPRERPRRAYTTFC